MNVLASRTGQPGPARAHAISVADIRAFYLCAPSGPGGARSRWPRRAAAAGAGAQVARAYVQAVRLAAPRTATPVALLHGGGGLTGACYESRLDGSPGWQHELLRRGYQTLVVDWAGTGRAPWPGDERPGRARVPSPGSMWELFRLGPPGSYSPDPARRGAYPGSRFPGGLYETFVSQVQPRFPAHARHRAAAFDALLTGAGPMALVSYSAAGPLASAASLRHPARVRAHVLVEPSGAPDPAGTDLRPAAGIPHLFLWGDYLGSRTGGWPELYRSARRHAGALRALGADVTWIDLPARGIAGNTHLLMFDDNAPQLLDLIATWLGRHLT